MPSEQRLHPISILFAFGGSLKAFALPGLLVLVAGRSSGGEDGSFGRLPANWEVWMMLFLIPAAIAAIARYLSFRVRYESEDLIIRSGIIFRNERHIPYSRIQNLEAVRNVFHRLFGVVEVRVENASAKETEAIISVLPLPAFEEMRRRVFEGRLAGQEDAAAQPPGGLPAPAVMALPEETLLQLPVKDLLLFGFIENRGLVVLGAIYGVLWEYGPLSRIWEGLVDEGAYGSGTVRDSLRTIASGELPSADQILLVFVGIAAFLLLVRLLSMAWAVVRLYGFRLSRSGEDLRTEFGLFTRVATTIPLRRIQTVTVREGPWHRLCGRVSVRVETAGGQTGKPGGIVDREWLAPLVARRDLHTVIQAILPGFDAGAVPWQPVDPRAARRAVRPAMLLGTIMPLAMCLAIGWRALPLLPPVVAWFVLAARRHVQHLGWAAVEDAVVFKRGWIWRVVTVARIAKIQAVSLAESPFDRRWAMARLRVDTAGASERSVRVDVPYLPRDVAGNLHERLAVAAARTDFRW